MAYATNLGLRVVSTVVIGHLQTCCRTLLHILIHKTKNSHVPRWIWGPNFSSPAGTTLPRPKPKAPHPVSQSFQQRRLALSTSSTTLVVKSGMPSVSSDRIPPTARTGWSAVTVLAVRIAIRRQPVLKQESLTNWAAQHLRIRQGHAGLALPGEHPRPAISVRHVARMMAGNLRPHVQTSTSTTLRFPARRASPKLSAKAARLSFQQLNAQSFVGSPAETQIQGKQGRNDGVQA